MSRAKRRLVILAQYDPHGGLPAHVRIHLERLQPIAARLVLVSNSPMSLEARRDADHLCDSVRIRRNIGWDFAGWRDALAAENMTEWDGVVLTNSSVVGPVYPLEPIMSRMENRNHDFWGMVHSREIKSHLQSYFLSFGARVVTSEQWREFWENVQNLEDKRHVIRSYEVGLTQKLHSASYSFGQLIDNPRFPRSIRLIHIDRLRSRLRIPMDVNYVNRTVELHKELIALGMPYLKASLLWGKDAYRRSSLSEIKRLPGVDYPWEQIGF